MVEQRATVTCPDCERTETFDRLGAARSFIESHRSETGHEATWELHRLSPGVERAGDEAGVCGRPGCTTEGSPLDLDSDITRLRGPTRGRRDGDDTPERNERAHRARDR